MKRENDEIVHLFHSRLGDAEMPVRDGFWEELNQGVAICRHRQRLLFFRVTAAASVLLVLAASSAAFWYFSPKEEIGEAFTQIAVANTGTLDGDVVKQEFKPIQAEPILQKPTSCHSAPFAQFVDEEEDSTSVTVSMSFSFSMSTTSRGGESMNSRETLRKAGGDAEQTTSVAAEQESVAAVLTKTTKPQHWALKAAVGTSLPAKEDAYKMPVSAGLTVERSLNKYLAVETGIQYTHLRAVEQGLHYLGIPVKLNFTLADTKKFDLYATIGGIADKCIAGAPNNSFRSEPVQLAVTAGIGMNYKINDKMALFAEPGVCHYFGTNSGLKTVRTERPTNFNLICGLRMTY